MIHIKHETCGRASFMGPDNSDQRRRDDRRKLIRSMLQSDIQWQKVDFENESIRYGKESLLEFVTNAGKIQMYLRH